MAKSTADLFGDILSVLLDGDVDFILVGGLAAAAMGSARATFDVDVVYSRHPENIAKLTACLAPHQPYLRGAPAGLPFQFDIETIINGLNFTLTTKIGDLDLLGEVAGGGDYDRLLPKTHTVTLFGHSLRCVTLECLIQLKRAAGRPKDLEALAELVALLEERDRTTE